MLSKIAFKIYCETKSQIETAHELESLYNLSPGDAENYAIEAYEEFKSNEDYKGEQQMDIQRGN